MLVCIHMIEIRLCIIEKRVWMSIEETTDIDGERNFRNIIDR